MDIIYSIVVRDAQDAIGKDEMKQVVQEGFEVNDITVGEIIVAQSEIDLDD